MVLRYALSFVLAVAVTFGLLFVMQALVIPDDKEKIDDDRGRRIEFVRLRRESEVQTRKREAPPRPRPQQTPSTPPVPSMASVSVRMPTQTVPTGVPVAGPPVELAGTPMLGEAPADTEAIPLVRVAPQYPASALARGKEGWVEVSFTIAPDGTVEDPVVIGRSSSSHMFDREALRAIKRWKYKPKVENGVPVPWPGVTVRLTFTLENP